MVREHLVGYSIRRPVWVLAGSVLFAIIGVFASLTVDVRLTAVTTVPGSPSAEADRLMQRAFGESFAGTFTIIVPFGDAPDVEIEQTKARVARAISTVPTARIEQSRALAGTLYTLVGTDLPLIEASAATPNIRQALVNAGLPQALLTGPPALEHDVRPVLSEDLRKGTLVGGAVILIVLMLAFGWSRLVVVPLMTAFVVIGSALAIVSALSFVMPVVPYVLNVIELVGLGIAIDYALLLSHRLRLELVQHPIPPNAIASVFRSAGRTVWWAGLTAGVSLLALVLVPVPFVRSLAVAGLVVPMTALIASHTVVPACMALIGDRVGRSGLLHASPIPRGAAFQRRPGVILALGVGGLLVCASPLLSIRIAPASLTAIPPDVPAMQAVQYLQQRIGPGAITPHELLIDVGTSGARSTANDAARGRFATWLTNQSEVFGVFSESSSNYVDRTERYQRIFVLGRFDFADERTADFVAQLRVVDLAQFGYADARLYIGGSPAQGVDFLDALRTWVPILLLALLAAAWIALSFVLRSRWLATFSVALNLLTLATVLGALVVIFQRTPETALPILLPVAQLESWALVLLAVLLFAMTLDYQLFLLARIRERFVATGSLDDAITGGVSDTAGVIMVAAIAFVGALSGLVLGHVAGLQQLGVGLALGVLLDASIIRLLLLPATARLLHRQIWTNA